jgi:hypothetical protein
MNLFDYYKLSTMSGSGSYYDIGETYYDAAETIYYDAGETIIGSGSGNGSGNGSGSNNYKYSLLSILLALSPLILVGTACIIFVIIIPLVNEIIRKYKNIKYKYKIYFEERNNPTPIKNNKLSQHFIKKCNKTNIKTNKKSLDCSICLDDINIEDYKKTPNDLIFLNCSHVFHTDCIQSWTTSQVKIGRGVNCPLCRDNIIEIPKIIYRSYSDASDASDASDDSVASYWND